jgi:hypothetical protein
MTIEDAIAMLSAALTTHAAAIEKLTAVAQGRMTGSVPAQTAEAPAAQGPLAPHGPGRPKNPPAASAPSSAAAGPAAAAASPTDGATAPIKYETVRRAVLKLAEHKGHQVAVGMLGEFGAKNGKDLKPADWPKALEKIEELVKMPIAQLIANFEERIA